MLASYACLVRNSKGRLYKEADTGYHTNFFRDCHRVIHSGAFRRLQYKTQVLPNYEGDHYRTRLTHSLEVAHIAISISKSLHLDPDLTEAIALSHDLGHSPFGHAGEVALEEAMKDYGGFDHNAQTIRLLTFLERRYADFDGLNLSWETLEGIAKHNGPLIGKYATKKIVPECLSFYNQQHDLELDCFPSLEAQVASCSDDLAYNNHDIEDGLRAGFITIADIRSINLFNATYLEVVELYPHLKSDNSERLINEIIRRIIRAMVSDIVKTSADNIANLNIKTIDDARNASQMVINFSKNILEYNTQIRNLLSERVYNHPSINKVNNKAKLLLKELFTIYLNNLECLPRNWQTMLSKTDEKHNARVVCDYISGMTDRYAIKEYNSFFDLSINIRL